MNIYTFCILKNEDSDSHIEWENACQKFKMNYDIVEMKSDKWYEEVTKKDYDCYLLRPPGRLSVYKQMYDERIYILGKVLGKMLYSNYEEVILHENKKMTAYWLKAKGIPHIETHIFYKKNEALEFINNFNYPIVGKTTIGSSGEGVVFLRNKSEASKYIKKAFSMGISRRIGPGFRQGNYISRGLNWIVNPKHALKKLRSYNESAKEIQKYFVIFQKYIPHKREIRVIKIGESYFTYYKKMVNGMCSGTKETEFFNPSEKLLNFSRCVFETGNFQCMSMDILDSENEEYYVNELQTIFGHIRDHLLEVNGKPGRYKYENGKWIFEEGNYNTNLSFDLRLQNVMEILNRRK